MIKLLKSSLEEFYKKKLSNYFDNLVFEDKCIELFKSKYSLKEFDTFAYFKKIKTKKGDFIIQFNFFLLMLKWEK